jgi:putative peptidoglycan lipid II flippase
MINILLNIILMKKYGAAGIAMASSITAWINALLLYRAASKYFILSKEVWKFILKTLICSLSMAITLYYVKLAASALYYQSSFILKALSLTSMISAGAISYLIFSIILGTVTKKELLKLKEKF